jgi:xylose isomerase
MGIVVGEREYFKGIGRIAYEGPKSDNPLAFRCYDEDRVVTGDKQELYEQLVNRYV